MSEEKEFFLLSTDDKWVLEHPTDGKWFLVWTGCARYNPQEQCDEFLMDIVNKGRQIAVPLFMFNPPCEHLYKVDSFNLQ